LLVILLYLTEAPSFGKTSAMLRIGESEAWLLWLVPTPMPESAGAGRKALIAFG
jgi:hypothetical protein